MSKINLKSLSVVHVIVSLDKGGAETHLKDLCIELVKHKGQKPISCTVVTIKGDDYWSNALAQHGIKTINLRASSYLQLPWLAIRLLDIICHLKADIVHAHLAPSELLVFFARLFTFNGAFPRIVTSRHNDEAFFDIPIFARIVELICTLCAAKIICISHAVEKFFHKRKTLPLRKSQVIHYGLSEYDSFPGRQGTCRPAKFLCLARLVYQKDIPLLIDAFRLAKPNLHPDSQLLIAGDGPEKENILKIIRDYGLSSHIKLLGFIQDTDYLLSKCTTLCLTSRYEGFGLVLLEAMRAGMPIICTAVSAIPEVVRPQYGWLISRGKNAAYHLSNAMIESEDPEIYQSKSLYARRAFTTSFTVEEMTSQTVAIYNELSCS